MSTGECSVLSDAFPEKGGTFNDFKMFTLFVCFVFFLIFFHHLRREIDIQLYSYESLNLIVFSSKYQHSELSYNMKITDYRYDPNLQIGK